MKQTGHKVEIDSLFSFIHGFLGYELQNPPMVSTFHVEEILDKNEVPFKQWLFQMRLVQRLYS